MKSAASILLSFATACGTSDAFLPGTPVAHVAPGASVMAAGSSGRALQPPAATLGTAGSTATLPSATSAAGTAGVQAALAPSDSACRPATYSLAVRLSVDMTWQETAALMAGSGKFYSWSKLTIDPSTGTISEFRMCGSLQPVYHGTAVAGNFSAFQRVPLPSYDAPSMPAVAGGSAMRDQSSLTLWPAPLLVGLQLPDVAGVWPTSPTDPNVTPVDADGDGKPGITSLMRNDAMFTGSPTSILQTERIDATYLASRLAFRVTLNDAACGDTLEGSGELLAMDSLLLGCHVKDRDDCRPEEFSFLQENRPQFQLGTAAAVSAVVVPRAASCTQAVQVLEVPAP